MLFSSQVCLEVGTVMEIRLLNDDADGNVLVVGPSCLARVVRRVLMAWPEVSTLVAVRFLECGFLPALADNHNGEQVEGIPTTKR